MKAMLAGLGLAAIFGAACGGTAAATVTAPARPSAEAIARADLAPTGHLRLGFPATPPFLGQLDPTSGQWKGLAVSLGNSLAAKLGVSLVPVQYADPEQAYHALLAGQIDVVLGPVLAKPDGTSATVPAVSVEHTYLVRAGSVLQNASDVDQPGIRVGSVAGSPHTAFLKAHLAHATLIPFATDADALAALAAGHIDAYANARLALAGLMTKVPGSRMLGGAFLNAGFGFVSLSSQAKGVAFLNSFLETEASNGTLQQLVQAIGKPGVLAGPGA